MKRTLIVENKLEEMDCNMESNKFDAIIFGNGMTINLFHQLKAHVNAKKLYLFNIDEFLKKFISNKLSFKEEQYIEKIFYKKKSLENSRYFSELKEILRQYYFKNNANIEKTFGRDLFKTGGEIDYNIGAIKSLFPALYNIWFNIVYRYIADNNLAVYVENFYNSVKSHLYGDDCIYTTNYDYLSDKLIKTKHIHGRFIEDLSTYKDIILYMKNEKEFIFKTLWGHNGIGKGVILTDLYKRNLYDKYFDFSFLFGEIIIKNLLIYGLSFQRSGYIDENYLKAYPKYKDSNFVGTVIDEHILLRITGLQNIEKLSNVTVSYFSENEKDYFMALFEDYGIKNIKFIHASHFDFNIE